MFKVLFSDENPSFAGVCNAMKNDLNHRFDFMIDETMDNFDCLYLLATELDPNYRLFVSGEAAVQNIVTRHINKTAKYLGLETSYYEDNEKVQEEEIERGTDGPRNLDAHKFKLLYVKTPISKIELELLHYIAMDLDAHVLWVEGICQKIDSLVFWTSQRNRFPYLSKLAFTLLALQASSAPSEREFSIAGWHCACRKNRTDKDNLAAKVFISCNKDILRPLLL
ncbi:Uncharacterized protein APZ42_026213 [Daphnia magna]|uniref:HAT C-terminal dimerisation domain-containing protein n=1 Tax=Daphnia magna TaxID=35525 RepID=A0A164SEB2_9CRUS|nr:Uncharacterized protein APZ42_026213 [Daphnia magna]